MLFQKGNPESVVAQKGGGSTPISSSCPQFAHPPPNVALVPKLSAVLIFFLVPKFSGIFSTVFHILPIVSAIFSISLSPKSFCNFLSTQGFRMTFCQTPPRIESLVLSLARINKMNKLRNKVPHTVPRSICLSWGKFSFPFFSVIVFVIISHHHTLIL